MTGSKTTHLAMVSTWMVVWVDKLEEVEIVKDMLLDTCETIVGGFHFTFKIMEAVWIQPDSKEDGEEDEWEMEGKGQTPNGEEPIITSHNFLPWGKVKLQNSQILQLGESGLDCKGLAGNC